VRTPKGTSLYMQQNQSGTTPSIDFQTACKVMPEASNLSLRILCGEVIHPEVDKFIKSTITDADSNAVCISCLIYIFLFIYFFSSFFYHPLFLCFCTILCKQA
jgi:hypothetical protein